LKDFVDIFSELTKFTRRAQVQKAGEGQRLTGFRVRARVRLAQKSRRRAWVRTAGAGRLGVLQKDQTENMISNTIDSHKKTKNEKNAILFSNGLFSIGNGHMHEA